MSDSHKRTTAKTITWRIIASVTTMTLVYLFTGEWTLSLGIGLVEVVSKMLFYYLHERAWSRIAWGKRS